VHLAPAPKGQRRVTEAPILLPEVIFEEVVVPSARKVSLHFFHIGKFLKIIKKSKNLKFLCSLFYLFKPLGLFLNKIPI